MKTEIKANRRITEGDRGCVPDCDSGAEARARRLVRTIQTLTAKGMNDDRIWHWLNNKGTVVSLPRVRAIRRIHSPCDQKKDA